MVASGWKTQNRWEWSWHITAKTSDNTLVETWQESKQNTHRQHKQNKRMKALKKADESDAALQDASRAAGHGSLRSAQGGDLWHLPYKVSINIYCHHRFYKNHKSLALNIKWQYHCEIMNKHKSETLNCVLKLGHCLLKKNTLADIHDSVTGDYGVFHTGHAGCGLNVCVIVPGSPQCWSGFRLTWFYQTLVCLCSSYISTVCIEITTISTQQHYYAPIMWSKASHHHNTAQSLMLHMFHGN